MGEPPGTGNVTPANSGLAHSSAAGAVERLAASERRFRAVVDATPNPVVAIDIQGHIIYVNPEAEKAFGYSRAELLGEKVEILLPLGVRDRHVDLRGGYVANPTDRPMGIGRDLAGRRKDGTEFPAEISLSPVRTSEGYEIFARIVDITARKSAESELLQAQKLESIGRLAGGIAHDFNNVLFAIGGYAELLEQDLADAGPLDRAAAIKSTAAISEAVQRAQELTSQLLSFSRRQVVQPQVVDLNVAVSSIDPMLRRLIGENIQLDLVLSPQPAAIRADPGQLDQILINLAVNARDAMTAGGIVTIATGQARFDEVDASQHPDLIAGEYLFLAVTDTGSGMERETREHIFEPFFTTKERGKGTGLGLATIYGIVRQAGGHIWVYSEPGKGSVFKLYFPRADAVADGEAAGATPGSSERPMSGTVLLVEDDRSVRAMTTRLLERAGITVIALQDGMSALEVLRANEPVDALLTDVIMPGMSGIELAERVLVERPGIGIVLLSGYTEETLDLDRLRQQSVDFVSKPVSTAELLRAVSSAMGRTRSSAHK